jgi:hypothetical protein
MSAGVRNQAVRPGCEITVAMTWKWRFVQIPM